MNCHAKNYVCSNDDSGYGKCFLIGRQKVHQTITPNRALCDLTMLLRAEQNSRNELTNILSQIWQTCWKFPSCILQSKKFIRLQLHSLAWSGDKKSSQKVRTQYLENVWLSVTYDIHLRLQCTPKHPIDFNDSILCLFFTRTHFSKQADLNPGSERLDLKMLNT